MLDLIIENAKIVDVYRHRLFSGWVGIKGGRFQFVEEVSAADDTAGGTGSPTGEAAGGRPEAAVPAAPSLPAAAGSGASRARECRDAGGAYLIPGFIDAHMHIESSLITPRRFSEAVLPFGTTTVLADPHEVANVAGIEGVRWMIAAAEGTALRIFQAIPSCVPATDGSIEWTRETFDASAIEDLLREPTVIALGEVMDYRSMLGGESRLPALVAAARARGMRLEGHIPTLSETELSTYLAHGITSDHTLTHSRKLKEQLSKGVYVMLQYKSLSSETVSEVMELPERSRIILVTDDIEPSLLRRGHLSMILDRAIDAGMPPIEAIASATIRPAAYLGLNHLGGVAPGNEADFMLSSELPKGENAPFSPEAVFVGGREVARRGEYIGSEAPPLPTPPDFPRVPANWDRSNFLFGDLSGEQRARVVTIDNTRNTLTRLEERTLLFEKGMPLLKEGDRLDLVSVTARDHSSSSLGLLRCLDLERGAFASSFAHDSHNILVVGRDPEEMAIAANELKAQEGGMILVHNSAPLISLPLPVLSLLSDDPFEEVAEKVESLEEALRRFGVRHTRPFLILSLLALSVSPYYKFSDRGIVDTEKRRILSPIIRAEEVCSGKEPG